jgi:hypothetical protein
MNNNYAAKFLLAGLSLVLTTGSVFAQTSAEIDPEPAGISDLQIQPIKLPLLSEVGGSPFMTADYQMGMIEISDKRIVKNVPVKFNILNNAIMILKDGQDMKVELFETVNYNVTANDGSLRQVTFRQGYPEIDNHNDRAVYQVLSQGPKVHLLKFLTQKVEDAATLGDYSRREIVTTQQLYLYTPGGGIKRIKANKQSVVDALPSMSTKIEEVVSSHKLNLKNENAIKELIEALNKP